MNAKQVKSIFGKINRVANALLIFGVIFSIGVAEIDAQKRKPAKSGLTKKSPSPDKTKSAPFPANPCVPPESENLSIIAIDKDLKLSLTAQTEDDSKILADSKTVSSLPEILSLADNKSIVTVRADATLDFGAVAKILSDIRHRAKNCVNVQVLNENYDQYAYLPPEPTPKSINFPPGSNPLMLVVELKKDNKITLNNEDQGLLNDVAPLTKTLEKIFKEREEYGVFRENSNEVEKTVFIKATPTAKFGDILKIAAALKKAGASPISLQIDDLENLPKQVNLNK